MVNNFCVVRTVDIFEIQFDGEKLTIFPSYFSNMMVLTITNKFEELYSYGFSNATKKDIIERIKQNVFQSMKDEFVQKRGL